MSWGAKPGSFYHPEDRWSTTVAEAEEHARFHAVDYSDPYDGYGAEDFEDRCEECGHTKFADPDRDHPEEVKQVCCFCGALYDESGSIIEED
tara:strand:- start:574 stop:849 length:276 start_codon:yes stop_codon:yes gene_type:complete